MALSIKPLNSTAFLLKIGISQSSIDEILAAGVGVKLTSSQLCFIPTDLAVATKVVDVSLDQLQQLHAGTLPDAQKKQLYLQALQAMASVYTGSAHAQEYNVNVATPTVLVSENPKFIEPKPQVPTTSWANTAFIDPAVIATKNTPLTSTVSDSEMLTLTPMKLANATRMYYPVQGTSMGSRYYVVAVGPDIRVAARYKSNTLSLRAEGPKLMAHLASLKNVGFSAVPTKGYASVHLTVPTLLLANKSLGSLLTGLGVQFDTPIPQLQKIVSK